MKICANFFFFFLLLGTKEDHKLYSFELIDADTADNQTKEITFGGLFACNLNFNNSCDLCKDFVEKCLGKSQGAQAFGLINA